MDIRNPEKKHNNSARRRGEAALGAEAKRAARNVPLTEQRRHDVNVSAFHAHTKDWQPKVVLEIGNMQVPLDLFDARMMAVALAQSTAYSLSDQALHSYLMLYMGLGIDAADKHLQDYNKHRAVLMGLDARSTAARLLASLAEPNQESAQGEGEGDAGSEGEE